MHATAVANIAVSTKTLIASFTATGAGQTLKRTRGLVSWGTDQQASPEQPLGAFGMCVVSEEAFAAGAASIPGPFTDDASDLWVVHQYMFHGFGFATNVGFQPADTTMYNIDSKAMRKINEDERLVVMIENGNATDQGQFWFAIRVLTSPSWKS